MLKFDYSFSEFREHFQDSETKNHKHLQLLYVLHANHVFLQCHVLHVSKHGLYMQEKLM